MWNIGTCWIYTSHNVTKNFSQAHGTLKNQPNKIGIHHNTFTPSLQLMPFFQLCLEFVSCVHRRIAEGSGVDSAECVVHVNSELCCGWVQSNCYWAWQICSVSNAEGVGCMTIAESVWYVGMWDKLWTFIVAEHGRYGCHVQKAVEWAVLSALLVCSYAII